MEPSFGPDRTETDGNCHVWKLERGAPSKKLAISIFLKRQKRILCQGCQIFLGAMYQNVKR
jgi:hypothetical protein